MPSVSSITASPALLGADEARSVRGGLLHSIARVGLVGTLLATPLAFGAVQPWAWGSLALLAVLLLLLWAAGQAQQGRVRIICSPLFLPAALFFGFGLIQFFGRLTLDAYATREALLKLATDLILFFVALQLFATASKTVWRKFGFAATLFAFAVAILAILQYFSSHGLIYWVVKTASGCTFGPYVNHNHYAGLMEMLIPLAAGYVLSRPDDSRARGLLGFAVLVPIASVLLSGSRGGLISLSAQILLLGTILLWWSPKSHRRTFAVMVALGATAAAALFFWMDPGHIAKRLATVADLPQKPEVTLAERMIVSRDSLRLFSHRPWTGTGLGSFEIAYPGDQSFATDLLWDHAHNDYAEALVETGLVGGFLILAAMGLFFRLAFRNLATRLQHEVGWIQLGAILGCCGLLVHTFGDFNFHIPANAAWFAMCVALGTHPVDGRTGNAHRYRESKEGRMAPTVHGRRASND